ncbi:MAG: acetyl-CoA carboxylase biotin carboxyl carrier protein [Planctomycetes bacterium]|nr:acetyl-CoA carboxylase biotin carboxyl carrier protein [Planctomycetota bacterium]
MSQKDTDLQRIKKLIDIMKENDLAELEIKHGDDKIHLKRSQPQQIITTMPNQVAQAGSDAAQSQAKDSAAQDDGLTEITSPIVGTFYARSSPDSGCFVETGFHVSPQTVVCIIEAMKVMNEIKAETTGTIVEILVTDGQAVEFGQPIFKVKPD